MFEEKWITERRKNPWLKPSKNFAKLLLVPFVPQNGQNLMVSYTFAEKSTFQIPQNYDVGSSLSVMTLKLRDIAEGGKPWNWCLEIIGGRKCPDTSENTSPHVICVCVRKHHANHQ